MKQPIEVLTGVECLLSSIFSSLIALFSLAGISFGATTSPTTQTSADRDWSFALVIGLALGAALVFMLALSVACCAYRRMKKQKGTMTVDQEKGEKQRHIITNVTIAWK